MLPRRSLTASHVRLLPLLPCSRKVPFCPPGVSCNSGVSTIIMVSPCPREPTGADTRAKDGLGSAAGWGANRGAERGVVCGMEREMKERVLTRSKIKWQPYAAATPDGRLDLPGTLLLAHNVYSPQLRNHRSIVVYLPQRYWQEPLRRYPVVYMQDGQNLFDPATSYAGVTWSAGVAAESLADIGREPIIVGIYHGGRRRIREYNPFSQWRNGRGAAYARFVAETVKPAVDISFRTLPGRADTAILGSSMGGLISLYTTYMRGDLFGCCGAMSPSLWVAGGAILKMAPPPSSAGARFYVDNGDQEPSAQRLALHLEQAGYQPGRALCYVVGAGEGHTEAAWARRLPGALRYLLG